MNDIIVIGIAGGTGSGKTTITRKIMQHFGGDVRDRGRSLESVVNQYLTTVKPMHEQFVEPSKRKADIIIPEGGHNQVALEMVLERVRAHITK